MEVCCTNIPALKSLNNAPQISCWDSGLLSTMKGGREGEELRNIINSLGEMSALAQRLRSPITSFDRILVGCHTLYLLTSGIEGKFNQILAKAMLKVGKKNLFIRKDSGHLVEMAPLCVLDFYVHESCQRMGLGYQLFEGMLKHEKKQACQLAYDRPSNKLLMFLAKHYKLYKYINQANQFVVFDDYFDNVEMEAPKQTHHIDKTCTSAADMQMEDKMAVSLNMPMKDKVLHGRRANAELDPEPCDIMAPDSNLSRLRKNVIAAALTSHATRYHRGRKNHLLAAQVDRNSQSAASYFSNHADQPGSPSAANKTLDALTGHRLNLQEQKDISRRCNNNNQAQPRKRYEALLPCINLYGQYDDPKLHAAKAHGLSYPSQSNILEAHSKQAEKCNTSGKNRQKPQYGGTRQMESGSNNFHQACISKAPPLTYPFWTEAKELSRSHLHDHLAVDYSKTRSWYQDRLLTHNPVTATWIL
ncbi:unnamed protein product [Sphagnum jensenii]|uniref:Alpha-tubulin N-acetyltransferase n=1 Tax=Sphagnum jensenii TaxID=128206 RepID=A0ABP1BNX6_9BRYO